MASIPQRSLFSWQEIDVASDLDRLRLVLSVLSRFDEPVMRLLESRRGRGRDDYPVRATWNSLIAGIVYQHSSIASLRRELMRNAELRELCGFDPMCGCGAVPSDAAYSRFLDRLLCQRQVVMEMFHAMVDALGQVLPELGVHLAVDSKAIKSFGRPIRKGKMGSTTKSGALDRRRDHDADWGTKTYKGIREDGTAWEKTTRWFGYKLHLLVDSVHELPLAFTLTKASAGDSPELMPLVADIDEHHGVLFERARELAADKGYDSADNKARLYDDHGIMPLIDHRRMWKDEPDKPRPLFGQRVDSFLYDELGQVYCLSPSERRDAGELRQMAFAGFEKDRDTLKYRCPAAAYDYHCPGRAECEACAPLHVGAFGRTIRVPLEKDRRIFTPIARHTSKWEKAYDRRTSVERVNARLDRVLGFEQHTIRGKKKMELRVGLALIVVLAMALGRIEANQAELMRSLTAPVRRAA